MRVDPLRELQAIIAGTTQAFVQPLTDEGASMNQVRAIRQHRVSGFDAGQTLLRVITRQHGEATPAQVLLCLAYREHMPSESIAYLHVNRIDIPDKEQLSQWCLRHLSTKQANLWMRLTPAYAPTMAWLCLAGQAEIQAEIRKLNLSCTKGRVDTGGKDGLQGFLVYSELFPKPPQQQQVHRSNSWTVLCGGDDAE